MSSSRADGSKPPKVQDSVGDNGKENGNYYNYNYIELYRVYRGYRGYIGIMEKNMETTIIGLYRGYIGV